MVTEIKATGQVTLDDSSTYNVEVEGVVSSDGAVSVKSFYVTPDNNLENYTRFVAGEIWNYGDQLKAILQKAYDAKT